MMTGRSAHLRRLGGCEAGTRLCHGQASRVRSPGGTAALRAGPGWREAVRAGPGALRPARSAGGRARPSTGGAALPSGWFVCLVVCLFVFFVEEPGSARTPPDPRLRPVSLLQLAARPVPHPASLGSERFGSRDFLPSSGRISFISPRFSNRAFEKSLRVFIYLLTYLFL